MERFREGDIVHVNTGLVYKHYTREYNAVLLWNGYNNQPLLTELGEYRPHWASYDEIESVIGHIDLGNMLKETIMQVGEVEINLEHCPFCGSKAVVLNISLGSFVECEKCKARTDYYKDGIDTNDNSEKLAIKAWNRRSF